MLKQDGRWGFISCAGKIAISPKYDDARDFSEGLAKVKISGKWGYIDRSGNLVIKPAYDDALDFAEGKASVKISA
ncbi:MAG: WG repeat-containing protein, partial [Deltaproteobacteria bacterium]|nr:WG repeat-containing protein [Deltaproteobacteria bacterium]